MEYVGCGCKSVSEKISESNAPTLTRTLTQWILGKGPSIKDVSPNFTILGYPPTPCLPTSPLALRPLEEMSPQGSITPPPSIKGPSLNYVSIFEGGGVTKCLQMLTWGRKVYLKCLHKHFDNQSKQKFPKMAFSLQRESLK